MLRRAALVLTTGVLLGGAPGAGNEPAGLAEARAHLDAGRFEAAKEAFEKANQSAGASAGRVSSARPTPS